jgi:hypothetical protein
MACFALPPFQDGSGSADWATFVETASAQNSAVAMMESVYLRFMISART